MKPEHHLQKDIIRKLVHAEHLRFSELKPHLIEGNIFTYHLQQLLKNKLIEKRSDGSYELTGAGKALGITSSLNDDQLLSQAHSILLMAAKSDEGWLLRRRLVQPVYGKWGFIHGEPEAGIPATQTAAAVFERRTGLKAQFSPKGSGYIRLFNGGRLESFTHFTLFLAEIEEKQPYPRDISGENAWHHSPDFSNDTMIASMADLVKLLEQKDTHFFADLRYDV